MFLSVFTFSDFLVFFRLFRLQSEKLHSSAEMFVDVRVASLRAASRGLRPASRGLGRWRGQTVVTGETCGSGVELQWWWWC